MNASNQENSVMDTTVTTNQNQRLVTILLVLLIVFVGLLTLGIIFSFLMMGSGMMGMGGPMMNNMMSACTEMMRNFQNP